MHIISLGFHYKTTPIELRERFVFSKNDLPEALRQLRHTKSILECTILSTCNRTEIYAVVDQLHTGRHFIKKFLAGWFDIERERFEPYVEIKEGDKAIRHLFEVSIGLDSMVIGETQILGQMKDAFQLAQEQGATGTLFNTLLKQVITLAKKVHAETEIGEHAVSISYAAVELAKKIYGDLQGKSVLLLGAGKMSELTAKHLLDQGISEVNVVNRTLSRAQELAAQFSGKAYPFERLSEPLSTVDIVISSTGSPEVVLNHEQIERVMQQYRGVQPLFLIDIAVPRDMDARINQVENVFLYDIDDLNGVVESNIKEREKAAEQVGVLVDEEIQAFHHWLNTLGVVPLINALRHKALNIQQQTMQSIENKIPDLSEREKKVLRKHTKSIINQMLRDPILRIKEMAAEPEPEADQALQMFTNIFALEEELLQEEEGQKAKELAKRLEAQHRSSEDISSKQLPSNEIPAQF